MKSTSQWLARWRPQFSLRFLLIAFTVLAIGMAYAGSYVSRSMRGRYEPDVIGLGGVKWYAWAPEGFVKEYQWNESLVRFYYPLCWLDHRFWHTPGEAWSGDYPVNEVAPEEIGKVYEAWGAFDPDSEK